MKKIYITLILTSFYLISFGQIRIPKIPNEINATNQIAMVKDEKRPSVSIYIADEQKKTTKAWKKYLSTKYEMKTKNKRGWQTCENCYVLDISDKTLSFYYKVVGDGEGSRISVIVKNIMGAFVDMESDSLLNAKTKYLLEKFTKEQYLKTVNSSIEVFQKAGVKMASEKLKLEKQKTTKEKKIISTKSNVISLNQKVDANQRKIDELNSKIALTKSEIEQTNNELNVNIKEKEAVQASLDKKNKAISDQNEKIKKMQDMKERLSLIPIQ